MPHYFISPLSNAFLLLPLLLRIIPTHRKGAIIFNFQGFVGQSLFSLARLGNYNRAGRSSVVTVSENVVGIIKEGSSKNLRKCRVIFVLKENNVKFSQEWLLRNQMILSYENNR